MIVFKKQSSKINSKLFRPRRTNIMSGVLAPPVSFAAIQINPFHDTIDLSTADGKKLYAKATQGLPGKKTFRKR